MKIENVKVVEDSGYIRLLICDENENIIAEVRGNNKRKKAQYIADAINFYNQHKG